MTIYKQVVSDNGLLETASTFAAIIFDCDGVLIDSTLSYDLALEQCVKSFASVLGFKNNITSLEGFANVIRNLRNLGTFNNDWDSLAVLVSYLYARSKPEDRSQLEKAVISGDLAKRLYEWNAIAKEGPFPKGAGIKEQEVVSVNQLSSVIARAKAGSTREEIISIIFSGDQKLIREFYYSVGYPLPAGNGFLATYFDTIMYGSELFEKIYGIPSPLRAVPGLISNEKVLVSEKTLASLASLCNGNLGILTGRPFIPTEHTLGNLYTKWFKSSDLCCFAGDLHLEPWESKPSPKPMLTILNSINDKRSPVLYIGDSFEDLLTARNANRILKSTEGRKRILFAAIARSESVAEFFTNNDEDNTIDLIVSNVNEVPGALEEKLGRVGGYFRK